MIDAIRGNAREVSASALSASLGDILAEGEQIDKGFKMVRDLIIFTNKRLILVDKQGVSGKKVEIQSIPYRSITRFAIETVGTFDLDSEMKIWLSGHSQPIERKLRAKADIAGVQRIFANYVLT